MQLNQAGRLVDHWWHKLPTKFPQVTLNTYQIMPNHIHGIVVINHDRQGNPTPTLGKIIQWFKTMTTNGYINLVKFHQLPPINHRLWQRDYYEHIIRSEYELHRIQKYIVDNPGQWQEDHDNPDHH
jgi:REP element-mobilizing transposase RayT